MQAWARELPRAQAWEREQAGPARGARRPGSWHARRAGAVRRRGSGSGRAQRAEVLRRAGEQVPRERGLAAGSERDGG